MTVALNLSNFWKIIDSVPREVRDYNLDHYEEYEDFLLGKLGAASFEMLANFDAALVYLVNQLDIAPVLYAGSLIDCNAYSFPMSDDGFYYFRLWVVSRGSGVYQKVLENADDLADLVDNSELQMEMEFESLSYIASQLVEKNHPDRVVEFETLDTGGEDKRLEDWTGRDKAFFVSKFPQIA